ncbi:MAG: outer membrane beta-barrel protein [Vicinamibacterales bacterium]
MKRCAALVVCSCALIWPASAEAQTHISYVGLFTPHIGLTTGGDVEDPSATPGASLAVIESRGWGVELDVAHAVSLGDDAFHESGLTSAMINVLYLSPRPGIQPFGVAGAGLLRLTGVRTPAGGSDGQTDLGVMLGGGVHLPVTEAVGLRGDLRYLRFLRSHPEVPVGGGAFSTWRLSVGVTLNFPLEP